MELLTWELPYLERKLPPSPARSKAIPPFPAKFQPGVQTPFLLPSGGLGGCSQPLPVGVGSLAAPERSSPGRCDVSPPQLSAPAPERPMLYSFPLAEFEVPRFRTLFSFVALFSPLCNLQRRSLTWQRRWNRWRTLDQLPRSQELLLSAVRRISSHLLLGSAKAKPKNNFQIEKLEFSRGHQPSTSHHRSCTSPVEGPKTANTM